MINGVWTFQAEHGTFPCAIFSNDKRAFQWIAKTHATGLLAWYPIDISVYDWAINEGHFQPKWEIQRTSEFIQRFVSNSQPHYHCEFGERLGDWGKRVENNEEIKMDGAWVFQAEQQRIPCVLFSEENMAAKWIRQAKASGILTWYPLDISAYDWAIKNDFFRIKYAHHNLPEFIQYFTSAAQPHSHWENGK